MPRSIMRGATSPFLPYACIAYTEKLYLLYLLRNHVDTYQLKPLLSNPDTWTLVYAFFEPSCHLNICQRISSQANPWPIKYKLKSKFPT
jgi:hypothetical protein